jgi:DNA-binding response OmpR family regulator
MRLLIVEDNEELAQLLSDGLSTAALLPTLSATRTMRFKILATMHYSAVVLDLGLPDEMALPFYASSGRSGERC